MNAVKRKQKKKTEMRKRIELKINKIKKKRWEHLSIYMNYEAYNLV